MFSAKEVLNNKVGNALFPALAKHRVRLASSSHAVGEASHVEAGFDLLDQGFESRSIYVPVYSVFLEDSVELEVSVHHRVAVVVKVRHRFIISQWFDSDAYFESRRDLARVFGMKWRLESDLRIAAVRATQTGDFHPALALKR